MNFKKLKTDENGLVKGKFPGVSRHRHIAVKRIVYVLILSNFNPALAKL